MSNLPVSLNLPRRTIDQIKKYCEEAHIKPVQFLTDTLNEYTRDISKLANAVAFKILSSDPSEELDISRITQRIPQEACNKLREIAKSSHLTFDGLTRIIFEDRIRHLLNESNLTPNSSKKDYVPPVTATSPESVSLFNAAAVASVALACR